MQNNQLVQCSMFDYLIPYVTEVSVKADKYTLTIIVPEGLQLNYDQILAYFQHGFHITGKHQGITEFEGILLDPIIGRYILSKVFEKNAVQQGICNTNFMFNRASARSKSIPKQITNKQNDNEGTF